jgi:hypothetical protein
MALIRSAYNSHSAADLNLRREQVQPQPLCPVRAHDRLVCLPGRDTLGTDLRSELTGRARRAIDFNNIAAARAIGPGQQPTRNKELIERSLSELMDNGWLTGEGRLVVTNAGNNARINGRQGRRISDAVLRPGVNSHGCGCAA